jgi:hypothetical protein
MDDQRRGQPRGAFLLGAILLLLAGCAVPGAPGEATERLVATTWGEVRPGSVTFSADGSIAAYTTEKDGRTWFVLGPWKSASFESIGGTA